MWLYQGDIFNEHMIGENYGFVYVITNLINGKKYIGRKYFWSKRTLPPLKGKTRKRHVKKPSGWQDYWSSSKIVWAEIEKHGKENFKREILSLHPDKRETNYGEIAEQVMCNVLEARNEEGDRIYYNENILSKFYPSKNYGGTRIEEHSDRIKRNLQLLE
jgi:hypothetical protein